MTGVCGRCGHFWDWHGERDNGACKGAYLIGMNVAACQCRVELPVGSSLQAEETQP